MELKKEDLLNVDQLEELIVTQLPNAHSKLLAIKLTKYCFILENEGSKVFYQIQDNLAYKSYKKDVNEKVHLITTLFIESSWSNLTDNERKKLRIGANGESRKITVYKNSGFKLYDNQLIALLTIHSDDPNMKFIGNTPNELYFVNGYYELEKGTFQPREFGKHYITKCINRVYSPSTEAQRNQKLSIVKQIYFNDEDLEAILMIFSSVISGLPHFYQKSLMLIGDGSTGKSTVMELMVARFDGYVIELAYDTFSMDNSKKDKILNSFLYNPQYRLAWLNEVEDDRMDGQNVYRFR